MLPIDLQRIQLHILNVGVQAAQYIAYSYKYDIPAISAYMERHLETPQIAIDYGEGQAAGLVRRLDENRAYMPDIMSSYEKDYKDYLLPFHLSKEYLTVRFPVVYTVAYYYTYIGLYKHEPEPKVPKTIKDFPPCRLQVEYKDLEGKKHTKEFDLQLFFMSGSHLFLPEKAEFIQLKIMAGETGH